MLQPEREADEWALVFISAMLFLHAIELTRDRKGSWISLDLMYFKYYVYKDRESKSPGSTHPNLFFKSKAVFELRDTGPPHRLDISGSDNFP